MTTAIDDLQSALAAGDDERAEAALVRLTPREEDALQSMLSADDREARWWSIYALSRCGSANSVPLLVQRLRDEDSEVRAAAVLALAHIQLRAANASAEAIVPMSELLGDEAGLVRQTASDALALCGDAAVPALAAVLADREDGARTRAMAALRKIATFAAAKVMFQHLNDSNYLVRTYAYEGLDEMGLLENLLLKP